MYPRTTAFPSVPLPARATKPRRCGLTLMIDWGLPAGMQADLIESAGALIDMAKIAASIPGLLPPATLARKVGLYREGGISVSQGGLFAELAWKQGNLEPLLEDLRRNGFGSVEISDNLLDWSLDDKRRAIRLAREGYGLEVLGEVGKKEGELDDDGIVADVETCLEAGASIVLLEAYELFAGGAVRESAIDALVRRFPAERLMFELPVVVLPGITREYKHRILAWLVRRFGSDVNLANVEWDELWLTEAVRAGAAGDTSHPQGAYRLAGFADTSES
jgi:phosphosulfolactate synthase